MKRGVSPDIKGHVQMQQNQQQSGQQPLVSDHLEVFNSSQSSRPGSYQSFENQQTWKLRRALQHKDIEQSQGREKSEERNIVRFYTDPPGPVSLSPLDYVKNRIVEVMRTSEEEGATKSSDSPSASDMVIDESDVPASQPPTVSFITTPHTYTYPFSALSLSSGTAGVSISNQSMIKTGSEPIPEPAPLLSSQYEPLSDED
jgi:nuclear receptor co-repressor 1